jgi:cytochrome c1
VKNFLLSIHLSLANGKDMPNPQLTEDQANDLAAYVMSLRKEKE